MFTWLKMHKNANSILEICLVAFFFFFFEHENLKNQTCLWRENSKQTNKPFEKIQLSRTGCFGGRVKCLKYLHVGRL